MITNIVIRFLFHNKSEELNLLFRIYYLIAFLFTFTVLVSLIFGKSVYLQHNISDRQNFIYIPKIQENVQKINQNDFDKNKILTSEHLLEKLDNRLFDIEHIKKSKKVPNIIIAKLPNDFKNIYSSSLKKQLFIKVALPLIVKENENLILQNLKIEKLNNKFDSIQRSDALWLRKKMEEYKVSNNSISELIIKVDAVPVSIALSQAAVESGWGTSRFASEGNALFGQYTWGEGKGIVPEERSEDEIHKIKSFKNLKSSVSSYMKNLNSNFHYDEFRLNRYIMRKNGIALDGIYLSEFLYNYSTDKDYPEKIKTIIKSNSLDDFDEVRIDHFSVESSSDII
tara:strand:+ start:2716 stop:3735 length:1020 start_codon:yes stop_codon:yes gene_type:complete